jgi:hypothetical protein
MIAGGTGITPMLQVRAPPALEASSMPAELTRALSGSLDLQIVTAVLKDAADKTQARRACCCMRTRRFERA